MKRIIAILLLCGFSFAISGSTSLFAQHSLPQVRISQQIEIQPNQAPDVYICSGEGAYAYHNYLRCSGLQRCKSDIYKTSRNKAVYTYKRKPCKRCYKV